MIFKGHFYEFYELNLYNYLMSWDSGDDIDKEKLYYAQPYFRKHFDAVFHDHLGNKSMVYGFEEDNVYYYKLMPTNYYDFYKKYQKLRNKNNENFPVDVIAAWMMKNGDIYSFNRNEEYCIRKLQCDNNETKCVRKIP